MVPTIPVGSIKGLDSMHMYRFLLRLWCTRSAKSRSFGDRCRAVWGTRYVYPISYEVLKFCITFMKPSGGEHYEIDWSKYRKEELPVAVDSSGDARPHGE